MRGTTRGPYGEEGGEAESRRLTPHNGLGSPEPASDPPPSLASNEDFLFHLYRGSELLQDNRAHEAKEELEQALQLQPNDAKGQDLLAVVYFRLGLYPRAISIYEQLRRSSPRDTALLLNLALCYLKTGQALPARRDLERLLALNPTHARAWGYLGLACERLGDLVAAERAFEQGGHDQMARRMSERRSMSPPLPAARPAATDTMDHTPSLEAREAMATAYEELDAGELSFELAKPVSSSEGASGNSWRSVELGDPTASGRPGAQIVRGGLSMSPLSRSGVPDAEDEEKPSTKDGPPPIVPHGRPGDGGRRRPTILVGVAPAQDSNDIEALSRVPSPAPPPPSAEDAAARRRAHVVVPAVRMPADLPAGPAPHADGGVASKRTLPPPPVKPGTVPPPPVHELTRASSAEFPPSGRVVMHVSGVALVHTEEVHGFAARLEAIRASSNGLAMKFLERHTKGKSTGEAFGGAASPLVHATGEGQLVLGPRTGRHLSSFLLEEDMCFAREEVLLGFDGALAFENGRLATGEGEYVPVVQLRGTGAVLLEAIGGLLSLEVHGNRGVSARRETILGWFGRLVPRALPSNEAPCGQRGLVSFSGEGRVLVSGA